MTDPFHDHDHASPAPPDDFTVDDILMAPHADDDEMMEAYYCGAVTIPVGNRYEPNAMRFTEAFAAFVNAVTAWNPSHPDEFEQVHASCHEALDAFMEVPNNALVFVEVIYCMLVGYDQASKKDVSDGVSLEHVGHKIHAAHGSFVLAYRMFMRHILDMTGSAWIFPIVKG